MRIQGFRGNCDSQASWGCAPVLPNRIREVFLRVSFQKTSRRQRKSFLVQQFFKNAVRGVGEQPTFAKQMKLYNEMKRKSRREPQIAIALKIERL